MTLMCFNLQHFSPFADAVLIRARRNIQVERIAKQH
jgi:hypothetical protein